MDLLGSILSSMDKPPPMSDKQKQQMKKQRDEQLSKQRAEKEKLRKFRESTEHHLTKFLKDPNRKRLKFPPFDQVLRGIVHELAEEAGMTAYSFGQEGVDRYIIVYKKEHPPSEDELTVLRRGDEWNEAKAKEMADQRERDKAEASEVTKKKEKFTPNSNYREKYQHLIGLEAAKDAARATQTNKQYGFVPSESKKDHRSIEQALADIQSKKKRKLNHEQQEPSMT